MTRIGRWEVNADGEVSDGGPWRPVTLFERELLAEIARLECALAQAQARLAEGDEDGARSTISGAL